MRYYSVKTPQGSRLAVKDGDTYIDLQRAYEAALVDGGACATQEAARRLAGTLIPVDLRELIEMGAQGAAATQEALRFAQDARTDAEAPWRLPATAVHVDAPVRTPKKFFCIGLNYRAHAAESNSEIPSEPLFFNKFATSITGPTDDVIHQGDLTQKLDYEVELGIVIGKKGKRIPEAQAAEYIFGYTVVNDISARDLQKRDGQWVKGKALDTYAPMGPCVVTADELDGGNLTLRTKVNGELRQESNTSDLIFTLPQLVSYLSQLITLEPGDVIITGTPSGVGGAMKPPSFLRPGDVVECEIDGIGLLRNAVVAEDGV